MIGLYECKEETLKGYYDKFQKLLKEFLHISFQHIPRAQNQEANRLAQAELQDGRWSITQMPKSRKS